MSVRVPAPLLRRVSAEIVGTFALVFAGCGAIMMNDVTAGAVTHVGVALTFGLVIMVMIAATGHISGAHFNPAVTVAFAAIGRLPAREIPAYVGGQVAAALFAAWALRTLFGPVAGLGATLPAGAVSQAFVLEVILTFFLMFVITAVATDERAPQSIAGLAIGGTVALAALFGGPISGASMNPARSIGPALLSGETHALWVYLVAPVIGAVLGGFTYQWVRAEPPVAVDTLPKTASRTHAFSPAQTR